MIWSTFPNTNLIMYSTIAVVSMAVVSLTLNPFSIQTLIASEESAQEAQLLRSRFLRHLYHTILNKNRASRAILCNPATTRTIGWPPTENCILANTLPPNSSFTTFSDVVLTEWKRHIFEWLLAPFPYLLDIFGCQNFNSLKLPSTSCCQLLGKLNVARERVISTEAPYKVSLGCNSCV